MNAKGFTLLEMTIVIMIMGMVTTMSAMSGVTLLASARQTSTEEKLRQIDLALVKYSAANDRIPCPAGLSVTKNNAMYGVEVADTGVSTTRCGNANFTAANAGATAIAVAEGAVPVVTLGLPADFMLDGWGNRIRYAVDVSMTYTGAFSGSQIGGACGALSVLTGPAYPAAVTVSSSAIYALVSSGPNGHGAYTGSGAVLNAGSQNVDEQVNCHCNASAVATTYTATYVQEKPTSQNTSNPLLNFDDSVIFRERWQMQNSGLKGNACIGIYVADSNNNRIEKTDLYGNYISQFGVSGHANGQFSTQAGVAVDNKGNIYVADTGYNRIEKFDNTVNYLAGIGASYNGIAGSMGASGTAAGQFNTPTAVAIDSAANIWVVDSGNHRIQKFDANLNYLFSIPASGTSSLSANGSFSSPYALAIDRQDTVWVADTANNRLQQFASNGTWLQSVGGPSPYTCEVSPNGSVPACASGSGNGQFNAPKGIALDNAGTVWVSDIGNSRIQAFSSTGTYLAKFSTGSSARGIATDSNGNIWIADTGNNQIQRCAPSGSCTVYGTSGSGNGQYSAPSGISFTSR